MGGAEGDFQMLRHELHLGWEVPAGWSQLWKGQRDIKQRSPGPAPAGAAARSHGGKLLRCLTQDCLNFVDLASIPLMHVGFKTEQFID